MDYRGLKGDNMKELVIQETKIISEFEIEVRPFITLVEERMIIESMLKTHDIIEQYESLVSNILFLCTDLFESSQGENEELKVTSEYAFEDILYSGFWDAFVKECPYIKQSIYRIQKAVNRAQGLEQNICNIIDNLVPLINDGGEFIKNLTEKIQDKNFMRKLTSAVSQSVRQ